MTHLGLATESEARCPRGRPRWSGAPARPEWDSGRHRIGWLFFARGRGRPGLRAAETLLSRRRTCRRRRSARSRRVRSAH